MTAGTLALAVTCGALFWGCGVIVAVTVRQGFFRASTGTEAVVVGVLVWICWALALGQLLGAVGLLRRGALLVAALATAGIALAAVRRWPPPAVDAAEAPGTAVAHRPPPGAEAPEAVAPTRPVEPPAFDWSQHLLVAATALVVVAVAAIWVARTVIAVHRGINDPDSLGYHLAFATTFAQTGYADQHRYVLPYLPVHFYPANDELLQAMALALTHSVAFAAVKNLLFGGFVLVAAHAIGKRYRSGAAAVAAAAIALGLPLIAFSQPGEAVNDTLLLLVLLGGLAVLAHARDRPAPYILAMAAAGAAVGIKFSAGYPAVALAILAVVLLVSRVPDHPVRWAVAGSLSAVALGGSWYLRNAITYHNPVPPALIRLGPLRLPQIATSTGPKSKSVLSYVLHGRLLSLFRHGLALGVGPLVAVVLGACVVGTIANLLMADGFLRGIGLYALIAGIGYIATPASAYGLNGPRPDPTNFVLNLRYGAAALLVALIAFALVVGRWRLAFLLPAVGVVAVATSVRPGQRIAFWSPEIGGRSFAWLLGAAGLAAGAVVLARWPAARRGAGLCAVGAAVITVAGIVLVADRYPSQAATDPVQKWAAQVGGTRVAAYVPDIALLYGPGSPNRVVTLTQLDARAPIPLDSCPAWMATIIAGRYPYTAVIPLTRWHSWLASDAAFKVVARDQLAIVFQVVGVPNINCPHQGS